MSSAKLAFLGALIYISHSALARGLPWQQQAVTAECQMAPNTATPPGDQQPITGTVTLTQEGPGASTILRISLSGFATDDDILDHGFHIHQSGDLSQGCGSTGGHYNPFSLNHGAPNFITRHVGDLGNIREGSDGSIDWSVFDNAVSLRGDYNVIGRAIVIHEKDDDLGLGGDEGSRTTGNAGGRLACCVITEVEPEPETEK